jgi:hypothetical protein
LKECNLRVCEHLLELIEKQERVIEKQNKMIAELINKNYEQENLIEVLMREEV